MPAVIEMPSARSVVQVSSQGVAPDATSMVKPLAPEPRPFTVREYHSMLQCGILSSGERAELLNGVVYKLMTKGTKHSSATDRAARVLDRTLGDQVVIRNQNPIELDDFSEPEPDLVLARPEKLEYAERHPRPSDILLIVEVADSSVAYDRDDKGLAYAKAGLVQYLLLNVNSRTIVDFRDPSADGYLTQRTHATGQSFGLVSFPELSFNVTDLLPPEPTAE